MYTISKVLSNNSLLVVDDEGQETILLGKGVGFGKKASEKIENTMGAKAYHLAAGDVRGSQIGTDAGIDPKYLEIADKIIQEAKLIFEDLNTDFLLPLADHIAFAARREHSNLFLPNPFIPDIKMLFAKEYSIAWKCRDMIRELAHYEVTEDEAGFIALHIHSGLSNEAVSETMRYTQIINTAMNLVEQDCKKPLDHSAFTYTRLESHLYYMIMRVRQGGGVNVDLNDYMRLNYSRAYHVAKQICHYMEQQLQMPLDPLECGYLAVHIERLQADQ